MEGKKRRDMDTTEKAGEGAPKREEDVKIEREEDVEPGKREGQTE